MGDYLRVSKASMEKDADRIEELLKALPKLIDELEQAMGQLSACWEGPAWVAYQKSVTEYVEELTGMYEQMGNYAVHIKEAAKEYGRAEQDICSEINKIYVF